jgi:hypothetical protein
MRRMRPAILRATLLCALLPACSPALDWREVRPEGSATAALFPCHPKSQSRQLALAGAPTRMTLWACEAEGLNFAVAHAELGDPARVTPALAEMAAALAANLQATEVRSEPLVVPGMTPNVQARRIRITGRLPAGAPVQEEAALFAHGTRAYQATVLGVRTQDAAQVFLDSLRVAP